MFADNERRGGSVQDCRGSLRGVALVALAAGWLAAPATAAAVPGGATTDRHSAGSGARGGENLLAGSPRIGTVEALVPRRGRDAGRLILWVRVEHAPGTARALARQRPETIHSGRVVARVGKRSRFATHRLELDRSRVAYGYFLRFSKPATRALAAGRGGRRVRVSLRVAQTLDLDSDGDREDRALATTTRAVQLARPATTIEPADGEYISILPNNSDSLQVSHGAVTHYVFGFARSCVVGDVDGNLKPPAPINPSDGTFRFISSPPSGPDAVTTIAVEGQFSNNAVTLQADINVDIIGGDDCDSDENDSLKLSNPPSR
jgi:hypothetical protein